MEKENNKINPGMDEGTMIREQERIAKAAKCKKRKKLKIITAIFIVVLAVAVVWYVGWGRQMLAVNTASTTVKIEKSAGQTVVYARIDEINGNEITYTVAEEVKKEENTESDSAVGNTGNPGIGTGGRPTEADGADTASKQSEQPSQGSMQMPQDGFVGGEMPDMGQKPGGGNMPDMSQMPGGFGGGEMPDMSQRQGGFNNRGEITGGSMAGNAETSMIAYDGKTYRLGTETVTKYIPVGTDVTTKLGTVTTFTRLAAEDYVALVMEKDGDEEIIAAVYIIG